MVSNTIIHTECYVAVAFWGIVFCYEPCRKINILQDRRYLFSNAASCKIQCLRKILQHYFLIGFYGAPTQFRSYGAEQERWFWLTPGVKNLKATPGVKTTSPAGAKRYIDSNCSIPFSRLLRSRRDKRWLQFLCRNP